VQVRHTLLELLFANADSSKTSWLFFAQSCSILARTEDRSHVQSRILEHYARINVSIPEEALELVFRPVKSGLYSSAVVKYVKDELLDRLQSCAGDTKTEEESEDVGSCGEHAEPRRKKKRCEIVPKRGRASKIDTAKLLVQVPQSIVELSGAQIRQHLREPDEEKELREALQTCLSLGPSSIDIQMALEGDEMAREKTLGGDDAEIASGTIVRRDQPGKCGCRRVPARLMFFFPHQVHRRACLYCRWSVCAATSASALSV
jgi:Arc/MetJ-type ribon-helix-helix transcriptional regulator